MLLDSEREEKEFLTELWWVFLEFNLHFNPYPANVENMVSS